MPLVCDQYKKSAKQTFIEWNVTEEEMGSTPLTSSFFLFEEGNGNPLEYCCLENSMDKGTWQATVYGVGKSQTRLSDYHSLINTPKNHVIYIP